MPGIGQRVFGIAAPGQQGADLVTGLPAAGADDHLARDFQAEDLRSPRWRRVAAFALQQVGPVDAGGLDLEQHLPRSGLRPRHLHQVQGIGGSGATADGDGLHHLRHGGAPWAGVSARTPRAGRRGAAAECGHRLPWLRPGR